MVEGLLSTGLTPSSFQIIPSIFPFQEGSDFGKTKGRVGSQSAWERAWLTLNTGDFESEGVVDTKYWRLLSQRAWWTLKTIVSEAASYGNYIN